MEKKAQGISINTIIIAAIALIVLVVLVAIFTGRMGDFGRRLTGEQNKYCATVNIPANERGAATAIGGVVRTESEGCGTNAQQVYGVFKDVEYGKMCCRTV
ncbi:MAG TPA: hypothetical protein VJK52_03320 [Candidatus Nanoarchaeia archaeon]|nr:hypothetical protein [Candidatus Nanoarchaeia archaeon]